MAHYHRPTPASRGSPSLAILVARFVRSLFALYLLVFLVFVLLRVAFAILSSLYLPHNKKRRVVSVRVGCNRASYAVPADIAIFLVVYTVADRFYVANS